MTKRLFSIVFEIALLAVVYFASARLGLSLAYLHPSASAVWPPTGIALAALLLRGYRLWPGVLLGAFLANWTTAGTVLTSLAIASGNTLEAVVGAWLVNRLAKGRDAFETTNTIFRFIGCVICSTVISATVGVTSLAWAGFAPWEKYGPIWLTWWMGDLVSGFNVAPFLLIWFGKVLPKFKRRDVLESVGIFIAVILIGQIVFGGWLKSFHASYLSILPILWAAWRFQQRGAVIAALIMSLIAVYETERGLGPFATADRNESLLLLETFMGTVSLTGLVLAALISERKAVAKKNAELAAVAEMSQDAIIGKNLEGIITSWNTGAEQIYGYFAQEMVGKSILTIIPEELRHQLPQFLDKLSRGGRIELFETVRTRKDGRKIQVLLSLSPVKDHHGEVIGASVTGRDITRRKRAEQAERKSHEQLQIAIEAARLGTWEWQLRTKKIIWSPNMETIHKMPHGSFGGTFDDFSKSIYPDDRNLVMQTIEQAIREGKEFRAEYRSISGDNFIWLEGRGRIFFDTQGQPERMMGICLDITERKRNEEALAWAAAIVQSSQDAIVGTTWEGIITSWNPAAEKIYGYAREEVVGRSITIFYPPDRVEELKNIREKLSRGDFIEPFETIRVGKNGKQLSLSIALSAVKDANGKVIGISGIARDIAERKEAERALRDEAALRKSEARFHELAEAMPQIIYTTKPDGSIDYANQRWFEYTGLSKEQTYTLNGFLSVVHPDDVPMILVKRAQSLRTSTTFQAEFRLRNNVGEYRWFLSRAVVIKNEQGQLIRGVGTSTDIEDRKRVEESLHGMACELEAQVAERTAELEESIKFLENFLYSIAHHLRAPLRAINGFTKILMEDYAPAFDDAGRATTQRIRHAAQRMDQLITALLSFGRLSHEELPCQNLNLDQHVEKALGYFADEIIQKDAEIKVGYPLPRVWANPVAIDLILNNLISNALKFVPPERPPRLEIYVQEKPSTVQLWLKDNGIGIEPEHQTRIFDIFERLTDLEMYPGIGLGLAVVRKAAERMGGEVGVQSEPGKGSAFWVELPVHRPERPSVRQRKKPSRRSRIREHAY